MATAPTPARPNARSVAVGAAWRCVPCEQLGLSRGTTTKDAVEAVAVAITVARSRPRDAAGIAATAPITVAGGHELYRVVCTGGSGQHGPRCAHGG